MRASNLKCKILFYSAVETISCFFRTPYHFLRNRLELGRTILGGRGAKVSRHDDKNVAPSRYVLLNYVELDWNRLGLL